MGELLERVTAAPGLAPAEIIDEGTRDPAEVVRMALRVLPRESEAGWIVERIERAAMIVRDAFQSLSLGVERPTP